MMSTWDACTMEPNFVLRWIECHPGLAGYFQALGSLFAISVAFFAPQIAARFMRHQQAARRRLNTERAVHVLLQEMKDVRSRCAQIHVAIYRQRDLPIEDNNAWSEWFTGIGFVMSLIFAQLDQWTGDTEVEPIAPFKNVAHFIREYNNQCNSYMIAGPVADAEQWEVIRENLLNAISIAEETASVAIMPIKRRWSWPLRR